MKAFIIVVATIIACENKTLTEVICDVNPQHCNPYSTTPQGPFLKGKHLLPSRNLAAPTAQELARWQDYEREEGVKQIASHASGWGEGPGDVNIATGLAAYTPIGGLGIRRDFNLAFGGFGRSGGRSFGFGDGLETQ